MSHRVYGRDWKRKSATFPRGSIVLGLVGLSCLGLLLMPSGVQAQLASLKTAPVPEPPNLSFYVRDRAAAIQLGKALFWDMQVGSDGVQACASCHFHAGADSRTTNQVNPAQGGFNAGAPNTTLKRVDFPYHKLIDPDFPDSGLARPDNNDVTGSQGVVRTQFVDIQPGSAVEIGAPLADPVFKINVGGTDVNIRQVTGRNTPSVVNAAYNFANFWDGRANNVFNGCNPFGALDETSKIMVNTGGGLTPTFARIRNASLASQAVGPPLSDVEMSYVGRTWPKIGKKMLSLKPLAQQAVHPQDSVLGFMANSVATPGAKGINTTYRALIKQAFQPRFWNNAIEIVTYDANNVPSISPRPAGKLTTDQFTQMEANFSLFFGLAVQLYEATLIANDSPFDRFMEGSGAQSEQELRGLTTFDGAGNCTACHAGPEFTNVSVANFLVNPLNPLAIPNPRRNPLNAIDFMGMLDGRAFYDTGFYNISARPTTDDIGRGADSPFPNSLVPGTGIPLAISKAAILKSDGLLPGLVATYTPNLPLGLLPTDTFPEIGRTDSNGAFKVPSLRNIELTGPYMHNGGHATLAHIVDFYTRGGDFLSQNIHDHSPAVSPIGKLRGKTAAMNEVVAFLLSLTDPRSKDESAPFDHPELLIPNGADPATGADAPFIQLPAVGNGGRSADGLPPLQSFLSADPFNGS